MTLPAAPAAPGLAALALAFRESRINAVDLAQAALTRISALEPRLQAFSSLDAERALGHARAIDALRVRAVRHFAADPAPGRYGSRPIWRRRAPGRPATVRGTPGMTSRC